MKKSLLALFLIAAILIGSSAFFAIAANSEPTRVINVVYDDSGSMIGPANDTWCQAKYAMEVFAAMLGTNDKMNIYVMSDFENGTGAGVKLALDGKSGADANVASVHNMLTRSGSTPFDSVRKAYSDLTKVAADDKWLVVLTDGEFQGIDDINAFFSAKSEDIQVVFLGMGPDADAIKADAGKSIYFEKADASSQILSKITGMCTRIFNRNKLEVNGTNNAFNIDIPMSELIVFAQGANVSINGIKPAAGDLIKSSAPVSVRYSEVAATNKTDGKIAKNLVGIIAEFDADFVAGDYTVDITGAETIEIYYKPNVELRAYLKDSNGKEVTDMTKLEAGEYEISFGFVKKGTNEKLPASKLLGNVDYAAEVTNNGAKHDRIYKPGDKIKIDEGTFDIEITANYLNYHSVSSSLSYTVYKNKKIEFKEVSNPIYTIKKEGFENGNEPITIKATIDGQEFTAEQWAQMGLPEISFDKKVKLGKFRIEKSDEIGIFKIYPVIYNNNSSKTAIGEQIADISYSQLHGDEMWSGSLTAKVHIEDGFSCIERHWPLIVVSLSFLLLLLLLVWWMTRKALPKKVKINSSSFSVDSVVVEGVHPDIDYKQNRRRGSLTITSPRYPIDPAAECGVTFELEAVDRRFRKSSERQMAITGISTIGQVYRVNAGKPFVKDPETNEWKSIGPAGKNAQRIYQPISNAIITLDTGDETYTLSTFRCTIKRI